MSLIVTTSSQPSTHARLADAWRRLVNGLHSIGRHIIRATEVRRYLAHGVTACSILLLLLAAVSYGDASTPADRFANLRDDAETQNIYATIMQSMPRTVLSVASAKAMWLGDTGAGMHCVTDTSLAIPGSIRTNSTVLVTANGTTKKASLAASAAVVTQGNREASTTAQMTAETIHARFNHRRAEVIRMLTQCTRDAPESWVTIARDFAREDGLRANSGAIYSKAHMPVAETAGDLVSYDIYYVSVPHIHGRQQYVIRSNFMIIIPR
eukprot:5294636-Pleurochrysis_carterae.AAC.2